MGQARSAGARVWQKFVVSILHSIRFKGAKFALWPKSLVQPEFFNQILRKSSIPDSLHRKELSKLYLKYLSEKFRIYVPNGTFILIIKPFEKV